MKKYFLIVFCVLIFALPMIAAAAEGPVLTPEIEAAMLDAYCATSNVDPEVYELQIEYYGEYDGCYVGFIYGGPDGYPDAELTVTLAGVAFVFPDYQQLLVCKDGQALNLDKAYEAEWLSDEAVQQLWNYYTNGIYDENPDTGDGRVLPAVAAAAVSCIALAYLPVFRRKRV